MECGSTALVDSQPRAARPHLSPLDRRMGSSRVGMESLRVGNLECGCATSIYSQPRAAMPQLPILPRKAMPHLVYLDEGSHRVLGDTVRRIDCRTSLRYVRNDRDKFVCVNRWNLVPVVPGSLTQAPPDLLILSPTPTQRQRPIYMERPCRPADSGRARPSLRKRPRRRR